MSSNYKSSKRSIQDDDDDFEIEKKEKRINYLNIIKKYYSRDISFFISKNKSHMNELEDIDENLKSKFNKMKQKLQSDDIVYLLILQSFKNINNYNHDKRRFTREERTLMSNNGKVVLQSIDTLFSFYLNKKTKKDSKVIENLLFKLVFNPSKDGSNTTSVYSVYAMHDDFIFTNSSFINFKSSTGSGKTRCAPFFFAIRMIEEGMKKPFFIMTQPSYSIILDKYKDFKKVLGSTVVLVKEKEEMLSLYKRYSRLVKENKTKTKAFKKYFSKPIIGLFSPHILLTLISKAAKKKIEMIEHTRFCLDEFHERSVDTDVLIATLSKKMKQMVSQRENFPMQVMMMSATPDPRVLRCFGKVDQLLLPDSQLFPIEDIKVTIDSKSKMNAGVISQTFEIIKRMVSGSLENGHILIFTSGNSRINDIQKQIFLQCENQCKGKNTVVKVIKDFEQMLNKRTLKQFYAKLDKYINQQEKLAKGNNVLFVLPIKYLGYVSNEQKEIGKNIIPNHNNVVKVIIATNAIESSITINNLAAVVDSSLFNRPFYDKDKGLTTLVENPISVQSQIQRRGRVGRVRPGVYAQIMIRDTELINMLPPEIQTTDITLNILSLRSIGYELEKIQNLPDKVNPTSMKKYIDELTSFGALDAETHKITPLGKLLGSFSAVSPFIVSAILKVAGYKICDKNKDTNDKTTVIRVLLGFLVSLIFGDSALCINSYSPKFQENYDQESDISTILMTFLDLMLYSRREVKEKAEEYGFNTKNVTAIIGQVMQTAELLPYFKKQEKEEMRKREEAEKEENQRDEQIEVEDSPENETTETEDTETNETESTETIDLESIEIIDVKNEDDEIINSANKKKKKNKKNNEYDPTVLSYKTIFRHLYEYAKDLKTRNMLNEFITSLIHEIGKNKPEWVKCRIVQFMNVENLYSNPSIIYLGDKSLAFENEARSLIYMRMRPGTFGLDCPFTGYILSIAHEENVHMNFGTFFHYDPTLPMSNSIVHPISIQCPISLNNDFANPLIEGYLSEDESNFKKFCRGHCTGADDGNILFFKSQGMGMSEGKNQICTVFTFIPTNPNAINIFTNALKTIEKLIPYTPSTILVPNNLLKCFVAIRGVGTDKIDSSVHLYKENQYHAYQINRDSLNYALENIKKLKSPIEQMSIAMTGENLSYPLSVNDDDDEKAKQSIKITFPQVNPKCTSVFSNDSFFFSHLVLLSNERIPSNRKINELSWLKSGISVEFSNDELIAHAASSISRELISIKRAGSCFIFTIPSSKLIIKGNVPQLINATMYFREAGIARFQEKRPVGEKMDLFAMHYIKGTTLTDSLEQNFESFFYAGNKLNSEVQFNNNRFRTEEEITKEINETNTQIGNIKTQKNFYNKTGDKMKAKQLNRELTPLFEKISELNAELGKAKEHASKRKNEGPQRLTCLSQIEQTKLRNLGPGCISLDCFGVNSENAKNTAKTEISKYYPNVEVEEIPQFQIIVKHLAYSRMSREDFIKRVEQVSKQFGAIVTRTGKYKENNNIFNKQIKGTISVFIYTSEFTIPFAGMIKSAFQLGTQYSILRIPRSIVDPYILRDVIVHDALKKWFSANKLKIQQNGNQWSGEENVVKLALQKMNENPPKIPYNSYQLPTETNLLVVHNAISRYKKASSGKWYINRTTKTLFVPSSVPEKQVQTFIEKLQPKGSNEVTQDEGENDGIDGILGDINFCEEEAELSRHFLNVFLEDGRIVQKNFCVTCVKEMFSFNLRKMFDEAQNDIRMDEIVNDNEFIAPIAMIANNDNSFAKGKEGSLQEIFPFISFGQMFWNFFNEEKISNQARAWITATAIKAMRKSQYFTFCPMHPDILIPCPQGCSRVQCITPGCDLYLCNVCNDWHREGSCSKKRTIPPGFRICPYCHECVEKSMACNYLACRCGRAFCYYCGKGVSEGYHNVTEHGSCYNNPPDYRKFVLGESISDEELLRFYQEYPQWRPDAEH